MGSPVAKAISLTGVMLAVSLAAEVALRLALHDRLPWFAYALFSGAFLGVVPSAPALVLERGATRTFRLVLAFSLIPIVLVNTAVVALINKSDLGWSNGDYGLVLPTAVYVIMCIASFYSPKGSRTAAS